jgi:hypothetical protein
VSLNQQLAGLWYFPSATGTPTVAPYPTNPYLKGGGVFAFWGQVQTGPSTYNWTLLDQLVQNWTNAGKPWNVRFNGYTAATGYGGSPSSTPMWLMDSNGPIYNLSQVTALGGGNYGNGGLAGVAPTGPAYNGTSSGGCRYCIDFTGTIIPAIWDAAYIAGMNAFASAVSSRYAGMGIPPAWVQTGVGHAGEAYMSPTKIGNPCQNVVAAASATVSTLTAGQYYVQVRPLYGSGAAGNPPQMSEGVGATIATVSISANQSIVITWAAPAVTTPAPFTITGYAIGFGTTTSASTYWNTVSASTFTYTMSNHGSAYTTDQETAGNGLTYRMLDLMGMSGDQTLMGNSSFTASSSYVTFFPTVAAALTSGQAASFPSVPCMALTVANPSGAVETAVDTACLNAASNLYIQNDGLTFNNANNSSGLATSLAKGFAAYEEKAQVAGALDLIREASTAIGAGVQVMVVFANECDAMVPASGSYTAAWANAGFTASKGLVGNQLSRFVNNGAQRSRYAV